jgi:hypothetical protein
MNFPYLIKLDLGVPECLVPERFVPEQRFNGLHMLIHKENCYI